jgi:hypothetical protein
MFSLLVIDTDIFLDMPLSSQALYFHLSMRADDDGFIGGGNKIQRMIGASSDDMKILLAKGFIFNFDTGVCVVKHWRVHNYIQKDRYTETIYKNEKEFIVSDKNNIYHVDDTPCIQPVSKMLPQVRLELELELDKEKNKRKITKNKKVDSFDDISKLIPTEYLESFKTFYSERAARKKPMTREAVKLSVKKLEDSGLSAQEKIECIENSIMNGYQGLFPKKLKKPKAPIGENNNFKTKNTPLTQQQISNLKNEKFNF